MADSPRTLTEDPVSPGHSGPTWPLDDSASGGVTNTPMRRDARRNRDRLLTAAHAAFAVHGADAPLEQIAKEAGVAVGTLYRHFPTRVDLLTAAFESRIKAFVAESSRSLEAADPWEGFHSCLEDMFELQSGDRGFNDFVSRRFPASAQTEAMHDRICELIGAVLHRAQAAGRVRPDIRKSDILTLIWANGRILEATSGTAPRAWRRHLHLMLDAYRLENATDLPEPPLSDEQLYDAMVQLNS